MGVFLVEIQLILKDIISRHTAKLTKKLEVERIVSKILESRDGNEQWGLLYCFGL